MVAGGTKVKFAIVTSTLQSVPWPEAEDLPPASPINNMCSELLRAEVPVNQKPRKLTGCISDETHRHNFYVCTAIAWELAEGSMATKDILFSKIESENKTQLYHPYLLQPVQSRSDQSIISTHSSLIRNEVLFPLGLALVELSLCQTIPALRAPEDSDPDEDTADLKTASRLLKYVYDESGMRYGDVVEQCLFWRGGREAKPDDEDFQEKVFNSIISPLLEDLSNFDGKGQIY
ncbi:hypothetical protein T310_6123 [Rasamsonia emersonii CBS 393.64]|uniref:DUF7580 domain-containing protein n=1 Tax=Rasamsonia emersonii (strain ATCC 16479 / CBS 393.64 / IMI 116815) TaxID=1408163 RepID=A0A0F4YQJ1_RASE3|nr:hypothetical protein T310_6123 [Rasamsonia emersonii CBS 393.64]KKA19893.1 hypothetical protein T310_6123 [Rasamsonia emersonii CBS 393.64]